MIERLHAGVTLTAPLRDLQPATRPAHTPEWTQHDPGDPGVTLVQLFAFLTENLLYRAHPMAESLLRQHGGVAQGLAVQVADAGAATVSLSAGMALGRDGQTIDLDAASLAWRMGHHSHRVDLSPVVSRYIGETEKQLGAAFADAPPSRAVLVYDDADALFGKRP